MRVYGTSVNTFMEYLNYVTSTVWRGIYRELPDRMDICIGGWICYESYYVSIFSKYLNRSDEVFGLVL